MATLCLCLDSWRLYLHNRQEAPLEVPDKDKLKEMCQNAIGFRHPIESIFVARNDKRRFIAHIKFKYRLAIFDILTILQRTGCRVDFNGGRLMLSASLPRLVQKQTMHVVWLTGPPMLMQDDAAIFRLLGNFGYVIGLSNVIDGRARVARFWDVRDACRLVSTGCIYVWLPAGTAADGSDGVMTCIVARHMYTSSSS